MTAGLLDTSVVIDWSDPEVAALLPDEAAITTITVAELAAGTHLAAEPSERARRQARLQQIEGLFDPLGFDLPAARSFGQVVAALGRLGRSQRGRMADLLIAAVAHANGLALYTRNSGDLAGLEALIEVVAV